MIIYIIVFVLYFLFIIVTALQSTKKVETMTDFTTGGNKMGLLLGVGTSIATWVSVASVMGVPGNIYSRGVCAVFGWVAGWFLATALMPLIAYKIRRPEVPTRTFPEYMRLRYDPFNEKSPIQIFAAVIELIGYFIFSYIQVQGFGIVFSTITGLSFNISVLFFMAILIFTCLGGFESVAATDTLNAVFILVGVIAAMAVVLGNTGGIGNIMQNFGITTAPAVEGQPPLAAGILGTPWGTFGASALISIFMSNCLGSTVAPHWVSRFMAPRNAKTAALQMFVVLLVLIGIFIPLITIGMGAKMLIPSLPTGKTTDYIFPTLIVNYCPPLLGALALTAICAAAVSTANSMLLHCSTSLIYDIKRVIQGKAASEEEDRKTTKELRIAILSLGILAVFCSMGQFSLLAMGFTYVYGAFGAVFFVPVWLGVYWKRMNHLGAFISMIAGLIAYMYCMRFGVPFGLPAFLFSVLCATIGGIIGAAAGKKPPLEAYEQFFTDKPGAKTLETAHHIRRDVMV
ncbi:MAG: sodium:solute symporter family protein [Spirochaetaceae bacterium]|nr:sodium:solute symporter family protein [Spirochaetaceae bacterium]